MKYSVNLIWSDEDQGYVATVPEIKNLSAFGETPEEALAEIETALQSFIETCKSDSIDVPAPLKLLNYSGQTRLRMPRQLHKDLALAAERDGVSLNTYMIYLLTSNYAHDDKHDFAERLLSKVLSEETNENKYQLKNFDKHFAKSLSMSGENTVSFQ